jgi:hypothetical protein
MKVCPDFEAARGSGSKYCDTKKKKKPTALMFSGCHLYYEEGPCHIWKRETAKSDWLPKNT